LDADTVPRKSKKQIKKSARIAARGKSDLANGNITPRAIRFAIDKGQFCMESGKPPAPPPEWPKWKRQNFTFSIHAAWLFLRGKNLDSVATMIGKPAVTRQRLSQMVGEGARFFLDRRFVKEADK
jgi:hypothetical protein